MKVYFCLGRWRMANHKISKTDYQKFKMWNNAARMRRHPTETEMLMWQLIKTKIHPHLPEGVFFRRQIQLNKYIVDFYCEPAKLILEVDGSAHRGLEKQDQGRDSVLWKLFGARTVRVKSAQVYSGEAEKICEAVTKIIQNRVLVT